MTNRPVFILGAPRSGTTLLRLMISSHPRIAIPNEATFLIDLYGEFKEEDFRDISVRERFLVKTLQVRNFSDSWAPVLDLLEGYVDRRAPTSYAEVVDAVYAAYAETLKEGACRWGDKNIASIFHLPQLVTLFPCAQFVHIVRDGRDVAASLRGRWPLYHMGGRLYHLRNPVASAKLWMAANLLALEQAPLLGGQRYFRLAYEDLVGDPEKYCRQLCRFLNESYDSSMLNYFEYNVEKMLISDRRLKANHRRTVQPIVTTRVGSWKRELPEWFAKVYTSCAHELLHKLGYEDSNPPSGIGTKTLKAMLVMACPYGSVIEKYCPYAVLRR